MESEIQGIKQICFTNIRNFLMPDENNLPGIEKEIAELNAIADKIEKDNNLTFDLLDKFNLVKTDCTLKPADYENISSLLRLNKSKFDGYVYVLKENTIKIKIGRFIRKLELLNPKLITEPLTVTYFDGEHFYKFEGKPVEADKINISEEPQ